MNQELSNELKIEGFRFPPSLDPNLRSRLSQVQRAALIVGLVSPRITTTPFSSLVCIGTLSM